MPTKQNVRVSSASPESSGMKIAHDLGNPHQMDKRAMDGMQASQIHRIDKLRRLPVRARSHIGKKSQQAQLLPSQLIANSINPAISNLRGSSVHSGLDGLWMMRPSSKNTFHKIDKIYGKTNPRPYSSVHRNGPRDLGESRPSIKEWERNTIRSVHDVGGQLQKRKRSRPSISQTQEIAHVN